MFWSTPLNRTSRNTRGAGSSSLAGGSNPVRSTWGVFYEFLRVVTHPRVFRKPWTAADAWAFLDALLSAPTFNLLVATERHPQVAEDVLRQLPHLSGNLLHDAHTAVLMKEHGIRQIYTRDSDFHRFPFVDVLDPMN